MPCSDPRDHETVPADYHQLKRCLNILKEEMAELTKERMELIKRKDEYSEGMRTANESLKKSRERLVLAEAICCIFWNNWQRVLVHAESEYCDTDKHDALSIRKDLGDVLSGSLEKAGIHPNDFFKFIDHHKESNGKRLTEKLNSLNLSDDEMNLMAKIILEKVKEIN